MPIFPTETRAVCFLICVTELRCVTFDPCTSGSTKAGYCKPYKSEPFVVTDCVHLPQTASEVVGISQCNDENSACKPTEIIWPPEREGRVCDGIKGHIDGYKKVTPSMNSLYRSGSYMYTNITVVFTNSKSCLPFGIPDKNFVGIFVSFAFYTPRPVPSCFILSP